MTSDDRLTWDFIREVLDVIERHGYHRGDNARTGQAIGLIGDVARIYEGTLDAPPGVPEGSYGRRNRQAIAARETRIATRLRAVEQAYRTATERDTTHSPPELTSTPRPTELQTGREIDMEAEP